MKKSCIFLSGNVSVFTCCQDMLHSVYGLTPASVEDTLTYAVRNRLLAVENLQQFSFVITIDNVNTELLLFLTMENQRLGKAGSGGQLTP